MRPSLVIVGLGNPGKNYENTRHNAGFRAIDVLSQEFGAGEWQPKDKFHAHIQEARVVTVPVLLVKPQTYMNRSGEAVQKLVDFYKLNHAEQLLILCDDIDLPLGELRLRKKGGPGTHNGLKSIVHVFGEDFPRLRIGLGNHPPAVDLAAWVLSVFPKDDAHAIDTSLATLPDMVRQFVLGDA
jgi:PTH1 family peptidyl-tRNA hydrolase